MLSGPSGLQKGPLEKPFGTQAEVYHIDLGSELFLGLRRRVQVALGTNSGQKKVPLERPWRPPEKSQERYHLVFAKDLSTFLKDVLADSFAPISQRRKTNEIQ